jgi:hypothetical protein
VEGVAKTFRATLKSLSVIAPQWLKEQWQAREGAGFAASQFDVDWQQERATCPTGKVSSSWTPVQDRRGNPVIKIKFAVQDCRSCTQRLHCTHTQSDSPRRLITVRPELQYQALQVARQRHKRVKRGLYRTSDGRYVNADINGAGNIIRKVAPDTFGSEGIEDGKAVLASLVVHPVRIVVPLTKPKSTRLVTKASGQ